MSEGGEQKKKWNDFRFFLLFLPLLGNQLTEWSDCMATGFFLSALDIFATKRLSICRSWAPLWMPGSFGSDFPQLGGGSDKKSNYSDPAMIITSNWVVTPQQMIS